ncbi:hypothetical protein [Methanobrevibacter sp.]|uniref:hypothetical protein n=1 Tax=Methanobrevibacter sp. TaxID=66852 RepID=UPI002634F277|nr:hypothetical protein [uncultured Methanobrevibacter sp.]
MSLFTFIGVPQIEKVAMVSNIYKDFVDQKYTCEIEITHEHYLDTDGYSIEENTAISFYCEVKKIVDEIPDDYCLTFHDGERNINLSKKEFYKLFCKVLNEYTPKNNYLEPLADLARIKDVL